MYLPGGVPVRGVYLSGGVPAGGIPAGGVYLPGGVPAGGCIPACTEADIPLVNGMTD